MKAPSNISGLITHRVLNEVHDERRKQDKKWGEQNHDDGTGGQWAYEKSEDAKALCEQARTDGSMSWSDILAEEFQEALAEDDQGKLRAELIQVAAVAVAWVECIDRRKQ